MKKLILILCLLSVNAMADDFRMKCKYLYDRKAIFFRFKGTLCEDKTQSCFIPKVWGQEITCVKK